MAWPPRDSQPVELIDAVAPADMLMLRDWERRLLLRGDVGADGGAPPDLVRSYIDPVLGHSPVVYGDFVRELVDRGLLNFMAVDPEGDFPVLGIFCVKKKNGMSRLIFDTRALNQRFAPAPHAELPSAAALCGMEVHGDKLVMSSCDVENAFYNFRVPISLARCVRLPPVAARFCGVDSVDGVNVADGMGMGSSLVPVGGVAGRQRHLGRQPPLEGQAHRDSHYRQAACGRVHPSHQHSQRCGSGSMRGQHRYLRLLRAEMPRDHGIRDIALAKHRSAHARGGAAKKRSPRAKGCSSDGVFVTMSGPSRALACGAYVGPSKRFSGVVALRRPCWRSWWVIAHGT